MQIKQVATKKS